MNYVFVQLFHVTFATYGDFTTYSETMGTASFEPVVDVTEFCSVTVTNRPLSQSIYNRAAF